TDRPVKNAGAGAYPAGRRGNAPPARRTQDRRLFLCYSCAQRRGCCKKMTLKVAIIGRPNVGKSTLFNRMTGKKLSIVDDTPGITRDWRESDCEFMGLKFRIVDTAGLEENFDDSIEGRMRKSTE